MNYTNFVHKESREKGFTLAEILVALAISGIVLTTITFLFQSQHDTYSKQNQVAEMQQNLRVAMFSMQREIRQIGVDRDGVGTFGVVNIQTRDMNNNVTALAVPPGAAAAITFTGDFDWSGGAPAGTDTVTYRMYDFIATDNNFDLARIESGAVINPNSDLVVENIEMMGLAFAFDTDNDGLPETYDVGGVPRIIWAVDTNNNNVLDANLDTNGDGIINVNDAAAPLEGGYGLINGSAFAAPLPTTVPISQIYAVRIWLMARTNTPERGFLDRDTYAVGRQLINPSAITNEKNNGGFRRLLLDTSVLIRNQAL